MIDYDQLVGLLKAVEKIELRIYQLNREKTKVMRQVNACGFDRVAFRELVRIRRKAKKPMPDDRVPELYNGLEDQFAVIRSNRNADGGKDDGTNDC